MSEGTAMLTEQLDSLHLKFVSERGTALSSSGRNAASMKNAGMWWLCAAA